MAGGWSRETSKLHCRNICLNIARYFPTNTCHFFCWFVWEKTSGICIKILAFTPEKLGWGDTWTGNAMEVYSLMGAPPMGVAWQNSGVVMGFSLFWPGVWWMNKGKKREKDAPILKFYSYDWLLLVIITLRILTPQNLLFWYICQVLLLLFILLLWIIMSLKKS